MTSEISTWIFSLIKRQSRLAGDIMFSTCPSVRPLPNRGTYFEHGPDEPILLQTGGSGPTTQWGESNFCGEEVKGRSRTTPKLDLETWRKHHFRPLLSSRFTGVNTALF